jgi:hypothetical protein
MTAHVQAVLTQAAAFILASTIVDGGRTQNGVLAGCLMFWITFFFLFFWHRCHVTRFDLFFLRWGSVPFLLVGTLMFWPLVESSLQPMLRPPE